MTDYRSIALASPRAEFVRRHPCYFLVGAEELSTPRKRASTNAFEILEAPAAATRRELHVPRALFEPSLTADPRDDDLTPVASVGAESAGGPTLLVLAVRKAHAADPARITVGRVSACDVVIPDAEVSRAHAYFVVHDDHVKLGDAGSAHGTMINGKLLEPNGPTRMVVPGDRLRFALVELDFLDAESAWDRIHNL